MIKNKKNETYRILNDKQNTWYCQFKKGTVSVFYGTAGPRARYC
jgi:hypothetical protein